MTARRNYAIPVSNGIFGHRKKIGPAIWVFLWCIDRTTKELPSTDGKVEGLVFGGQPVPLNQIASDLEMSWHAVQEHLSQLTKSGYLRKIGQGNGRPNGYAVVNSKRFAGRQTYSEKPIGTYSEKPIGTYSEKPIGTYSEKPRDLSIKTKGPIDKNPHVDKEEVLQDNTRQRDSNESELITAEMIAQGVLLTLSLSGRELLLILSDICRSELQRGETPDDLRDSLTAAWADFSAARSQGKLTQYAPGAQRFFGEGFWKTREVWAWKEEYRPQLKSERRYARSEHAGA